MNRSKVQTLEERSEIMDENRTLKTERHTPKTEYRKYAYFPGCSLHGTAVDYSESVQAVAGSFGIELAEIPGWTCCGSTPAHLTDDLLAVSLPVKNILRAKEISDEIAVCCAACYSRFKFANKYIKDREDIRNQVTEVLGMEYSGNMKIRHLLDILINDVGLEKIEERVKKNLGGLKVACYYGCLLTRPPKVVEFDDPEDPTSLDNLMRTLGAEPISWPYKTECCGATFSLTKTDIVLKLSHDILAQAKKRGAQAIVLACPLCQSNLDLRQGDISEQYGVEFALPIFYFTQLLGLALGLDGVKLGLQRAMVSPMPLLKEKGVLVR